MEDEEDILDGEVLEIDDGEIEDSQVRKTWNERFNDATGTNKMHEMALAGVWLGDIPELTSDREDDPVDLSEYKEIITIDDETGDTFEITREVDAQYDLYPIELARPIDLFQKPLYKRQPGETLIGYQQFIVYANIHPGNRTIQNAWLAWNDDQGKKRGTPSTSFFNLARHWRWKERAYILDLQKTKLAQRVWVERDVERREQDWDAGQALREKAFQSLKTIDPEDMGANSIARFFDLASALQEKSVPQSGLDVNDLTNLLKSMPDDRRGKIIEIVAARIRS